MDLTVFNNLEQLDSEIGKKFNVALDGNTHVAPDRHLIGESLPTPDIFPKELGAAPSFGQSPVAAREDHVHGMTPWSGNASTDWYGLEGANAYILLGNPQGTHHAYFRTKTNLDSLYLGVNGANTLALNPSGNHVLAGKLEVETDVTSGWFRSVGNTGWFSSDWTVGIYATDADWVRAYSADGFLGGVMVSGSAPAITATTGHQPAYWNTTFGWFARFTSSGELKEEITEFIDTEGWIDKLRPVKFRAKAQGEETPEGTAWREADYEVGFLAEEVHEVDPLLASYEISDGEMTPVAWRDKSFIALLVSEVQSLRLRVAALEA